MSLIRLQHDSYINVGDALYIYQTSNEHTFVYNEAMEITIKNERLGCSKEQFHANLKNAGFIQGFKGYAFPCRLIVFVNVSKILHVYGIHMINGIVRANIRFLWQKKIDSMEFDFLGTIAELHEGLAWRPTMATQAQFDAMHLQFDELRTDVMYMPGGPVFQAAAASFQAAAAGAQDALL